MARGTSISETGLIRALNEAALQIKKRYGISIWFAEVLGRRWSYIGGIQDNETAISPAERIRLTDRYGFFSEGWNRLSLEDRQELINLLRETIRNYAER